MDKREKLLYKRDLDRGVCDIPDCGCSASHSAEGLYLSGRCHPKMPTSVRYVEGALEFFCGVCDEPICRVAVKDFLPS